MLRNLLDNLRESQTKQPLQRCEAVAVSSRVALVADDTARLVEVIERSKAVFPAALRARVVPRVKNVGGYVG
jgi:hypothetical protein